MAKKSKKEQPLSARELQDISERLGVRLANQGARGYQCFSVYNTITNSCLGAVSSRGHFFTEDELIDKIEELKQKA